MQKNTYIYIYIRSKDKLRVSSDMGKSFRILFMEKMRKFKGFFAFLLSKNFLYFFFHKLPHRSRFLLLNKFSRKNDNFLRKKMQNLKKLSRNLAFFREWTLVKIYFTKRIDSCLWVGLYGAGVSILGCQPITKENIYLNSKKKLNLKKNYNFSIKLSLIC